MNESVTLVILAAVECALSLERFPFGGAKDLEDATRLNHAGFLANAGGGVTDAGRLRL